MTHRSWRTALTMCAALAAPAAYAQTLSPQEALSRLFNSSEIKVEWFAPAFLQAVPFEQLAPQLRSVTETYGRFLELKPTDGYPRAVFEKGELTLTGAQLDSEGRFTALGLVPVAETQAAPALSAEDQQTGVQLLETLLRAPLKAEQFSPDFLAAVPLETLQQGLDGYVESLGPFQKATATPAEWRLEFQRGSVPVTALAINAEGQINGWRLGAPVMTFGSWEEAKAAFAALPGEVSVLVQKVGSAPLLDLRSNRLLAVGSSFKLAILAELQAQVRAGQRQWTDEVTLTDAIKSLPSGSLQDAAAGNRYSLQNLATRMIRDSDNTATDLLLETLGRAGVEARLGQKAMPSTREAFALKNPDNIDLLRAYRASGLNLKDRREVLAIAGEAALPNAALFSGEHTVARDVEWFVSAQRLCRLMGEVAALPSTQANPGVASKNDFTQVSYKGGSEPGVLNLTTQVINASGERYCVSATWNRPEPLNETAFLSLYSGLLQGLR